MSLVPDDVLRRVPSLYSTESMRDPLAQIKVFTPWSAWTWYVTEYDGEDLCFGLVVGQDTELGYFRLSELEAVRGPGGLRVERDDTFVPTPLSRLRAEVRA